MKFSDWFTQYEDADIRERVRSSTRLAMRKSERERGRDFLVRYMAMHPARHAPRTSRFAFLFHPVPVIASLLIIAVSGVSVAGAAEQALPGDALYAIKVNVNEEVKLALAVTPEKKAAVSLARAETRLAELDTLIARGDINETTRDLINERIDEHVRNAEEVVIDIDTEPRETTRRVVALLRSHEALVAPEAVGGYAEPEASLAAFAAAESAASIATTPLEEPVALMAAPAGETAARVSVAPMPAQEMMSAVDDVSAKRAAPTPPAISEKSLRRQERAARERIEALEKFLAREAKQNEKRKNVRDTSVLASGLASARDAFESARAVIESGNALDASALFNNAVRFAIDARETYTEGVRDEALDHSRDADDRRDRSDDVHKDEIEDDRTSHSRGRNRDD
jgi:hypothetical protein